MKNYYHMFANGEDARDFILEEEDFYAAFNRFGVCAAATEAVVLSFSVEDSHPHALLYGEESACLRFKALYETTTLHYIVSRRGSASGLVFFCELYPVNDQDYLRNVAAYTIVQPTKDGKRVMYYDYLWGTGSLYFRPDNHLPLWTVDRAGKVHEPRRVDSLTVRSRKALLHSKREVPGDWLVCNGFLLPDNYVDIRGFESIYQTHNRFRAYCSSGRNRDNEIIARMADSRGVMLEDLEARKIASSLADGLFGIRDVRKLDTQRRIALARRIRSDYRVSFRQLAMLVYLPEPEIRKYVR
ncbi:MAG: hypothetical protein K5910_03885 [Bacteroidales bacterium]|nr:hypothetical protein [Bacteroidales bacterium]